MDDKKKNLIHRLSIVEGQIRGIKKMISENKSCKDIIMQITAAKSAIENTMALILTQNLAVCLESKLKDKADVEEVIKETIGMLTKII